MAMFLGLQRDYFDRLQAYCTSITREYYFSVIKQLRVAIIENQRGKLAAGVLQLHDNAPVYKSRVGQTAIRECKFEQLNHPPYSPDLAPSDYNCFFRKVWKINMGVCPRLEFDNIMFIICLGYDLYIYGAFEFLCNSIAIF